MARVDLGLSEDDAWGLTPRLIVMLTERKQELQQVSDQKADRRAGEVVAMLANVNRDSKKRPKPWTWLDVFPAWRPPPPPQTEDDMLAAMDMLAALAG